MQAEFPSESRNVATAVPRNRLVIGLDYGTTFTGVAFHESTGTAANVEEISLVLDWPNNTAEKVPSEISYGDNGEFTWGYGIPPNSRKLVWTKLELDEQKRPDELRMILEMLTGMGNLDLRRLRENDGLPSYPGKDPVDIVADFLSKVRKHLLENLRRTYPGALLQTLPIDLVITVPAVWSDLAKDRTFRAITKAGFDNSHFPSLRETIMVTEPEAAAIYTLKSLRGVKAGESIRSGDCFVLCDAGGGTVDCISYRMRSVSPFKVEEAAIGTGSKCGGSFVDRNFKEWLEKRLGATDFKRIAGTAQEGENSMEPRWLRIMRDFKIVRETFTGETTEQYIALPRPLHQMDDDPSRGIVDGELRITDRDLREMFDPCIQQTLTLIRGQIDKVQRNGSRIKYIFLVGGFGRSVYMFSRVREFALSRDIEAMNPKFPWSAVARGAVAKGLEQDGEDLVYMRKCRRHYGVSHCELFSSFRHQEKDAFIDEYDGRKMARGQMTWLIQKGDSLITDRSKHASIDLVRRFGLNESRVFETSLVACDDDEAPQRYADKSAYTVTTLTVDLNGTPTDHFDFHRTSTRGEPYYTAHFQVDINLQSSLKFSCSFGGQDMGSVTTTYQR